MRSWKLCMDVLWCAVTLTAFPGAQQEQEFLSIWPRKPVVEFGGSIVLNCSASCKNIVLETSLNNVPAGDGPTWRAFSLTSIRSWEPKPLCFATCQNTTVQEAAITVYRAPERVVLDPLPEVEVGKEYNVTCRVFNVAPIRNLTVTLYKGKKRLYVETFEDHRNPEAGNVVVTSKSITAQQNDHGEEVSCHTALDLRPEGPLFEKGSNNLSGVLGGRRRGTWKPSGLSLDLNISLALCVISDPPEQVVMELQKSSTGHSWHYNLKCHIVRVAPLSKLTVTFFKEAERLHSQKLWNYTRPERANVTVTHPITLRPWDHGKVATCHVTLDFSPHKKPFTAASHKVQLRTAESSTAIIVAASSIAMLSLLLVYYLVWRRFGRALQLTSSSKAWGKQNWLSPPLYTSLNLGSQVVR
ncbi:intercellular adhesion molecule 1-like [Lacerta agilis]|uniref:intercellular adhesion molecule 1-like n=1 Tax=Lacerta agilis TaxID=80427 RepID=UPI001419F0D7|nr:intercellular adhesion molecule 1-like [Lacerta agilis]